MHTFYSGLRRHCQQILRRSLRLLKRYFNGFIVFVAEAGGHAPLIVDAKCPRAGFVALQYLCMFFSHASTDFHLYDIKVVFYFYVANRPSVTG